MAAIVYPVPIQQNHNGSPTETTKPDFEEVKHSQAEISDVSSGVHWLQTGKKNDVS